MPAMTGWAEGPISVLRNSMTRTCTTQLSQAAHWLSRLALLLRDLTEIMATDWQLPDISTHLSFDSDPITKHQSPQSLAVIHVISGDIPCVASNLMDSTSTRSIFLPKSVLEDLSFQLFLLY